MTIPTPSRACLLALATLLVLTLAGPAPAHARLPGRKAWLADVSEAMAGSVARLDRRAERGGRLAINLDIDNTALATHYDQGDATPDVLRFARRAHRHGMAVLFNTARSRDDARRTVGVLRRAGYPVDGICARRAGEQVVDSKQRCRRSFAADGYTVVANVGNNPTDFRGSGYERAYRLPNYGGRLS